MRHLLLSLAGLCLPFGTASAHGPLGPAIAALSWELEQDPDDASLHLRRGELYRLEGDWSHALADYARATELDPAHAADVDQCRAQLHLDRGAAADALRAADRALRRTSTPGPSRLLRAEALAALGRFGEAGETYRQAIGELHDLRPDHVLDAVECLRRTEGAGVDVALLCLEDGLERLGACITLELRALDLELELARHDVALARIDRLMAEWQRKESWLVRRGDVLVRDGRPDEARAAYAAAVDAIEALPDSVRSRPQTRQLAETCARALAQITAGDTP